MQEARVASPEVLPPVLSLSGRGQYSASRALSAATAHWPRSLSWPAKEWCLGEPSTIEGRRLLLDTSAQGAVDISVPEVGETHSEKEGVKSDTVQVFLGGIAGATLVFYFSGQCMTAAGLPGPAYLVRKGKRVLTS